MGYFIGGDFTHLSLHHHPNSEGLWCVTIGVTIRRQLNVVIRFHGVATCAHHIIRHAVTTWEDAGAWQHAARVVRVDLVRQLCGGWDQKVLEGARQDCVRLGMLLLLL